GYVAMASTAAGVGGSSQFYINVNDNSGSLDGKYAVFGKVIVGMDAANALANLPTTNQYPNALNQPADPSHAMLISVTISNSQ
ncbi:MAG: peptidylprolyl isomerase, partial [Deltaproteobacteria bacterium]